jgi:hypothetical protein
MIPFWISVFSVEDLVVSYHVSGVWSLSGKPGTFSGEDILHDLAYDLSADFRSGMTEDARVEGFQVVIYSAVAHAPP